MQLKKIKEKRLSKGWSCAEVSKKLGMSKTFYWQIEHGDRKLTYILAVKIAKLFNAKPDALFYDEFKNID